MVALVLGCLGSLLMAGGGGARRVSARGSFAPAEMMTASGGGPMGDPFLVVEASNEQLQASVAYNSQDEEYLVVYQNNGTVGLTKTSRLPECQRPERFSVSSTLNPIHPLTLPTWPTVAQHNKYLVVWQDDTSGWPSVRGALVTTAGGVTSFDKGLSGLTSSIILCRRWRMPRRQITSWWSGKSISLPQSPMRSGDGSFLVLAGLIPRQFQDRRSGCH